MDGAPSHAIGARPGRAWTRAFSFRPAPEYGSMSDGVALDARGGAGMGTLRERGFLGCIGVAWLSLILLVSPPSRAHADWADELGNLACLKPGVLLLGSPSSATLLVSKHEAEAVVYVALKSKLPRLRIDASCEEKLTVSIHVWRIDRSDDPPIESAFALSVEGSILRQARFLHAPGTLRSASVGDTWFIMSSGPIARARPQMLENIERLVNEFAAHYYRAGNP